MIYPLGAVLPFFSFFFFRLFAFCLVFFFFSILCKQNCKYGDWLNSVYQELWYSVFFRLIYLYVSVHLYPQSLVSFYGRCVHLHAHICLGYSIFRILKQKETGKWLFITKVVLCPLEKSALWICRKGYFTPIILQSSDKFPSLLKCPSTCLTFFSPFWCSIFFFCSVLFQNIADHVAFVITVPTALAIFLAVFVLVCIESVFKKLLRVFSLVIWACLVAMGYLFMFSGGIICPWDQVRQEMKFLVHLFVVEHATCVFKWSDLFVFYRYSCDWFR